MVVATPAGIRTCDLQLGRLSENSFRSRKVDTFAMPKTGFLVQKLTFQK